MLQLKRDIRIVEGRPVGFLSLQGYLDSMDSMKLQRAIDGTRPSSASFHPTPTERFD